MHQAPNVRDLAKANFEVLWARASKVALPIAAIGGFISDVLSPLGPFVSTLAILTGGMCVISGVVWFGFKRRQIKRALADGKIDHREYEKIHHVNSWSVAFAFSLVASCTLMLFFGAQKAFASADPDKGVMANVVPQVAMFQKRLLGLEEKTARIDATTQRLETKADEMSKAIARLDEKIDAGGDGAPEREPACAATKDLSPYARVFVGDGVTVEMATLKAANGEGQNDVILRLRGPAAFEAGLDGESRPYRTKAGFYGGTDYVFEANGQENVRFIARTGPEGEYYKVFLKDEKALDVKVDTKRSRQLCPSELAPSGKF